MSEHAHLNNKLKSLVRHSKLLANEEQETLRQKINGDVIKYKKISTLYRIGNLIAVWRRVSICDIAVKARG